MATRRSLGLDAPSGDLRDSLQNIVAPLLGQTKPKAVDLEADALKVPAPNIIEFATGPLHLNIPSVFKHKRQYQVLRDFFQYRCPLCNSNKEEDIDCWDKSREYLESEVLLVWSKTYGEDVCPKCGTTRSELLKDGLIKKYNQLHGIVGMRSGKTATVGIIGTYVEHKLITIAMGQPDGRLSSYFGVLPNQPFEVTFIASTEVQSSDTIWAYYRGMRADSPWFKRYVKWVKQREAEQDTPKGMGRWQYQETTKEIENGHIWCQFSSKNSNSAGLAGRTRLASFIDELCRFKQTESSMGAEEAYRVMENSLRTVRSAVLNHDLEPWLGLIGSISSPISIDDKGMELLYRSTQIPSMYAFHYATWDFNPDEKREYYDEAFEKDPVGTERDFGAKPPLAANPLVIDPQRFEARAIATELKPTAVIEIMPFTDKTGQQYLRPVMVEAQLQRDIGRYVVFDAGQTFDAFTGACGHLEIKQMPNETQEFITVVDWVFRVLPTNDREVWFDSAVDLMEFQMKHTKVAMVEFDRWNSTTLIQLIRNLGIRAEQKSLKPVDFIKFVADAVMGRVRLLGPTPEDKDLDPPFKSAPAVGIYELERLERSIDDMKVFNPQKGKRRGYNSDDVATVLVHLHKMVMESQVMPTGAKLRSREARLKREEVGSQQWQFSQAGTLFSPGRMGIRGAMGRRW